LSAIQEKLSFAVTNILSVSKFGFNFRPRRIVC